MRNKIFKITFFLASVLFLSSCLKDNVGEDWTDSLSGKMYAEVWKAGYQATGLAPVPDPVVFKFLVNIATDALPTQNIVLKIEVDSNAMKDYNALKNLTGDAAYKLYPYIEILDPEVTIEAGTRNAYVHVKVWNADKLDACDNFMAPIVIKEATGGVVVSAPLNNGARLMALPISNPYAADYNTVGYRIRPGNPTEPIAPGTVETFSTVNCKTVDKVGFGNYGSYNIRIEVTDTKIVVDGVDCVKVIATPYDPATGNSVGGMFTTWTGDPATAPPPPADPSWINYYNPTTKQFVLNCYYNSTAGNRIMYEIHTRI
jgi:hypothetical protein